MNRAPRKTRRELRRVNGPRRQRPKKWAYAFKGYGGQWIETSRQGPWTARVLIKKPSAEKGSMGVAQAH